jgi:hypothetical protein
MPEGAKVHGSIYCRVHDVVTGTSRPDPEFEVDTNKYPHHCLYCMWDEIRELRRKEKQRDVLYEAIKVANEIRIEKGDPI